MRDRLIKLLQDNSYLDVLDDEHWLLAAEQLLANGVIVPPCKVGDTVYADIIHRRNGDFIDECVVKYIEWDADWNEPLYTIICMERATYRTYWASEFKKEFFKEPKFAEKKSNKMKGGE